MANAMAAMQAVMANGLRLQSGILLSLQDRSSTGPFLIQAARCQGGIARTCRHVDITSWFLRFNLP